MRNFTFTICKRVFFGLFLVFFVGQTRAQHFIESIEVNNPDVDFVQSSMAEFSDGVYVIAGTITPGLVSGASDILVLKVDANGTVHWKKYLDYGEDEFVGAVMVDKDKNIVLTGYTGTNGTAAKDLIVVKLNKSGNLVRDMIIRDTGIYNYGLYGLDIVQMTSTDDYLVVGTGVNAATQNAPKYAFAMRLGYGLGVLWADVYNSPNLGPDNYNSFNHILKVEHQTFGETYLLTGSGATPAGTQMAVNALIDANGNGLWTNGPSGYLTQGGGSHPTPGIMALYNEQHNKFYVVQPAMETAVLAVVGGNTGLVPDAWYIHNHNIGDWSNIVTGMVWKDTALKNEIVFSGYHINPNDPISYPILFSMDIGNPTNFSLAWWQRYHPVFNAVDYKNVALDFIVQPLNRTGLTGGDYNAFYYWPKALVRDGGSFNFTAPGQEGQLGGTAFHVNFLRTPLSGEIDNCFGGTMGDLGLSGAQMYSNFQGLSYTFTEIGPGASVHNAAVLADIFCGSTTGKNSSLGAKENKLQKIKVYPNPVENRAYISGVSDLDNIKIVLYDIRGKVLLSTTVAKTGQKPSLDMSVLSSGVYFVRIFSENKIQFTERVVKE